MCFFQTQIPLALNYLVSPQELKIANKSFISCEQIFKSFISCELKIANKKAVHPQEKDKTSNSFSVFVE